MGGARGWGMRRGSIGDLQSAVVTHFGDQYVLKGTAHEGLTEMLKRYCTISG